MTIAVFGGTGRTGRIFVKKALNEGHKVRILARDPDKLAPEFGMEMVGGDALDGGKVMLTLSGCQAVAVFLGPVKKSVPNFCSKATELILQGAAKVGISRVIAVTSLGVGDSQSEVPFFVRALMATVWKPSMADKEAQESLIRRSSSQWTLVRPSGLTDVPSGLTVYAGQGPLKETIPGHAKTKGTVSRSEVAHFVWAQLLSPETQGKTFWITT